MLVGPFISNVCFVSIILRYNGSNPAELTPLGFEFEFAEAFINEVSKNKLSETFPFQALIKRQ